MTTPITKRDGLISRVVGWLRAGYPEGVPAGDYVALLGVLQRTLTPTEFNYVVKQLADEAATGQEIMTRPLVEQRIEDLVKGPVLDEDIVRVSARLAAAGWPLGSPEQGDPTPEASNGDSGGNRISRVVGWLREGYPTGLPERDYIPLVALLRRRLTDDEVAQVSRRLSESGVIAPDRADVGAAIAHITAELPSPEDMERVSRYLEANGWPVDFS